MEWVELYLPGLLAEQAAPVARVFAAVGLALVATPTLADDPAWSAVVMRKAQTR